MLAADTQFEKQDGDNSKEVKALYFIDDGKGDHKRNQSETLGIPTDKVMLRNGTNFSKAVMSDINELTDVSQLEESVQQQSKGNKSAVDNGSMVDVQTPDKTQEQTKDKQ